MRERLSNEQVNGILEQVKLELLVPYKNYKQKLKCRCLRCKKIVHRSISSIKSTKTQIGCQRCSLQIKSEASGMQEVEAREIFSSLGLIPTGQFAGSQKKWQSVCIRCGSLNFFAPSYLRNASKRYGFKIGCPYCRNHRMQTGDMNKLFNKFGLKPMEAYKKNSVAIKFECLKCGSVTKQSLGNIQKKQRLGTRSYGCPGCSFKEMGSRYAVSHSEVKHRFAMVGLELIGAYSNARNYMECKCAKCGAITKQSLNGVNNGKTCKFCSEKGLALATPSHLYLIQHKKFESFKVGIGNIGRKNDRLQIHIKQGWDLLQKWNFESGKEAQEVETRVFKHIRGNKKLPIHLSKDHMPQGGWSETINADSITLPELEKIIKKEIRSHKLTTYALKI